MRVENVNGLEYSPSTLDYSSHHLLIATLSRRTRCVDEVRERISARPGLIPNLEQVADELAVSPRTLRRRLAAEGTNFQKLLDQVRLDMAREYLAISTLTVGTIAELLGFSHQANFGHAFKRWCGLSPRQYREKWAGVNCYPKSRSSGPPRAETQDIVAGHL